MHKTKTMFIHCLTGIHPGSGTALGFVDLPVQRERHTKWPVIPGTTLKGVLRATCTLNSGSDDKHKVLSAFGSDSSSEEIFAGSISISDARILALPVRSMRGVFAWTTCPSALELLNRSSGESGSQILPDLPAVEPNTAITTENSPLVIEENKILLEEFDFDLDIKNSSVASEIAEQISKNAISDPGSAERFRSHMVILSDDDFTHFTQFATEVTARIRLNYETKSVQDGALFYEESLPPETIFHALTIASDSRKKGSDWNAEAIMEWLEKQIPSTLQIGAGETVGKGFCAVRFMNAAN